MLEGIGGGASQVGAIIREAEAVRALVVGRPAPTSYPDLYPVGTETAFALYGIVGFRRPLVVVETGVADGLSTAMILAAM
jgi:hypothetical protein